MGRGITGREIAKAEEIGSEQTSGWFRRLWRRRALKRKLRRMDEMWYSTGGNCFGLFPPSFYYTHTKEEAERIVQQEMDRLREIAAQVK